MPEPTVNTPIGDCIHDDLASGQALILLADVPRQPWFLSRANKRINKCTLFRWRRPGVKGVRLRCVQTPAGAATTQGSILRFFDELEARVYHTPAPAFTRPTPARRQRQIAAAERQLQAAGIC